jgi:adenine-specific DNA-methyltransferase
MGTKRHLVPDLARVIADCKPGIFLDVFSGMCSVGHAVASSRQVWSNDLQSFSQLVAQVHFCSAFEPLSRFDALAAIAPVKRQKADELSANYAENLKNEHAALQAGCVDNLSKTFDVSSLRSQGLGSKAEQGSYNLFCERYAGTYFGYGQAIEIDSIRYAIDTLLAREEIAVEQWRAMVVAMCIAMSKCSNSTGHFAQPLYPKTGNIKKVVSQRKRTFSSEWLDALEKIQPVGNEKWRSQNLAFRKDATSVLSSLREFDNRPSVVYADPPYTKDQYSRYYHIYETAVLYDYPSCSGAGLYRPDRATSTFSLSSKVTEAITDLIKSVSDIESCLVLSYPTNGLLTNSVDIIPEIIKQNFGQFPEVLRLAHRHSTMGSSKGVPAHDVTEVIYRVSI